MEKSRVIERNLRNRALVATGAGIAALTLVGCSELSIDREITVLDRYPPMTAAVPMYKLLLEECDRFDSPDANEDGCITEVYTVNVTTYNAVEEGDTIIRRQVDGRIVFEVVE